MVRFAYESGTHCLYPNPPADKGSLVTSHREAGTSYGVARGPSSSLMAGELTWRTLVDSDEGSGPNPASDAVARRHVLQWQLDVRTRRAGNALAGVLAKPSTVESIQEQVVGVGDTGSLLGPVKGEAVEMNSKSCTWSGLMAAAQGFADNLTPIEGASISPPVLAAALDTLLAPFLFPTIPILHVVPTALLPLTLAVRGRSTNVHLYSQSHDECRAVFAQAMRAAAGGANTTTTATTTTTAAAAAAATSTSTTTLSSTPATATCVSRADMARTQYPLAVLSLPPAPQQPAAELRAVLSTAAPDRLLVLGPCAGGATDLSLSFSSADSGTDGVAATNTELEYSLVGDACMEGDRDEGAKLYRRRDALPAHWQRCRIALVTRQQRGVAMREVVCAQPKTHDEIYV